MSYNKNTIYINIPHNLKGEERRRYIANEKRLLAEKNRKFKELSLELEKREVRLLETQVLKKQEALAYKEHVIKERTKLGLE